MNEFIAVFSTADAWITLLTLTFMEIVLGIDNIIFVALVTGRLPAAQQPRARAIGLTLALLFRVLLLLGITWIARLTSPLFAVMGHDITGRDIIFLAGGLFLLAKSTSEIHHKFDELEHSENSPKKKTTFTNAIVQIVILDIVFSFDSVVTAVGLANDIEIMIIAVVISLGIMLACSGFISSFINKHPTIKMLALSFLLMIGMLLVAEGWHLHVPKGYVYFAMAFSMGVEFLNMKLRAKSQQKTH